MKFLSGSFFGLSFFLCLSLMAFPSFSATAAGEEKGGQAGEVEASPLYEDPIPVIKTEMPHEEDEKTAPVEVPLIDKTNLVQTYFEVNYDNLVRTLWAMNAHALDDDLMIDNYLKVTECNLYRKFYMSEFEWQKIRGATRKYLMKYKDTFPKRYEYVQPIFLDRYDFSLRGFSLMPDSVYQQTTRLEIASGVFRNAKCGDSLPSAITGYPDHVALTIRRPFKLSFIRVNEALAKEYLAFLKNRFNNAESGRPAFVRFRVRLDKLLPDSSEAQALYTNYEGVVESIEIFADRDLMFKLYEQAVY